MDRGAWQAIVHGLTRVGHDLVTTPLPPAVKILLKHKFTEYWNSHFHIRFSQQSEVKEKSLSRVWLFATPWTVAYQAPPSMGFSRQEYWSGLPFPSLCAIQSSKVLGINDKLALTDIISHKKVIYCLSSKTRSNTKLANSRLYNYSKYLKLFLLSIFHV